MAGVPWTDDERADLAQCKSYGDFIARGHRRTFDAFEKQKRMERCREKLGPAPKPEVLTPPPEPVDGKRIMELFSQLQQETQKINRSQRHIRVRLDTPHPIGCVFVSDMHLGSAQVDYDAVLRFVQTVKEQPGLYVFMGGDIIDNFILDKLAHAGRDGAAPDAQWEMARWVLRELAPKTICCSHGNHDSWCQKAAGIDPHLEMLRDIPVAYIGEGGVIDLVVGQTEYRIYKKHRGRASINNALHGPQSLFRLPEIEGVDCVVVEHHHAPSGGWWPHGGRRVLGLRTGTFKVVDPHALEYGHFGGGIGTPVLVMWPDRKRMIPLPDLEDAADFIAQWWPTTDETT